MERSELEQLINELRHQDDDGQHIEAKKSGGGFPKNRVEESVSAFANASGGVILLGIDQETGFAATGVPAAANFVKEFAEVCSRLQPPVRPEIVAHTFEGVDVISATIAEADRSVKPVYTSKGTAFVRVGDQDRRLHGFELQVMRERSGAPDHDCRQVDGTSIDDLDPDLLQDFETLIRAEGPPQLANEDRVGLLTRMRVLGQDGQVTVAGLLALGRYPQQFLPQVNATFVNYASADGSEVDGVRFLDSRNFDGPIGSILQQSEVALRQNMARRQESEGMEVRDSWEYPPIALREAIANGLVHRDLSTHSRGAQVQIEMYPDRLEVRSPGGLHGTVTSENIGSGANSSRNGCLVRLLTAVRFGDGKRIVENRGSGIKTMIGELTKAGMRPPEFDDDISTFNVRFPANTLLGPEIIEWVASLDENGLSDSQVRGLAMLKAGARLDNPTYRRAMGLDSRDATGELQDLVSRGLAVQIGAKRWTRYALRADIVPARTRSRTTALDRRKLVLNALGEAKMSREQISALIGRDKRTTNRWLSELRNDGFIRQSGKSSSHNVLWEATDQTEGQMSLLGR